LNSNSKSMATDNKEEKLEEEEKSISNKPKIGIIEKATPERLLSSGYYKSINGVVLGSIQGLWGLILLPRIMPYPEALGIGSTVAAFLGLIATLLDWGIWRGYDVAIAAAYGVNDLNKVERYSKTVVAFKMINGLIFNLVIAIFLIFLFPTMQWDYRQAYFLFFLSHGIRWLGSFVAISERTILAAQRFDYEFYYQTINFFFLMGSRLFWFYLGHKTFPENPITGFAIAIAISETIETFFNWTTQSIFAKKARLLKFRRILKPALDRKALKYFFHYGKFVVGRQYLLLFSEVNSTLWIFLVRALMPNPETIVGVWVFAIGAMGPFYMASNMNMPILPSMADAYNRRDYKLIQEYWLVAIKWFSLWGLLSLGLYVGWGDILIVSMAGEAWRQAGIVCMLISPAFLFKLCNEMLCNILYGANYPKGVLISTALKIPFMVVAGILLFRDYLSMSLVFFLIEFIAFLINYNIIKNRLNIKTPNRVFLIPGLSGLISLLLVKTINYFLFFRIVVLSLIFSLIVYFIIFFLIFLLLGGFDDKDFKQFEGALEGIFKKSKIPRKFISKLRKIASKSPFYLKITSATT